MPSLDGLTQHSALDIARMAYEDCPGLTILLRPLYRRKPMTDLVVAQGFSVIVAGTKGQKPWFEVQREAEYPAVLDAVQRYYRGKEESAEAEPEELPAGAGAGVLDFLPHYGARAQDSSLNGASGT